MTALEAQAIIWHDLLVSARPAETLIDSSEPLAVVRSLWPLLCALWPQILLGLLFVIALCAGAWLLTSVASLRGAGAALAVLGAFGVSATTISAKAKNKAIRLVERLRNPELEVDRVWREKLGPYNPGRTDLYEALQRSYTDPTRSRSSRTSYTIR